jgi:hypothetical protein
MTQNKGPTSSSARALSHGRSCSQPHSSIPTSRRAAALAVADEHRSAPGVEIVLGERERLLDSQPGAPQDDDHRAQPETVAVVGSVAHHRDNLIYGRRVGGVAQALVARRAPGVVAGHCRRRSAPARRIEHG